MRQALVTVLALGALSGTALAQQGSGGARAQCRDCAQGQGGDSTRVLFRRNVGEEIEAIARRVVDLRVYQEQLRSQLERAREAWRESEGEQASERNAQVRQYTAQLALVERQQRELQSRLGALCSRGAQPAGWMGVVFSGNVTISKTNNGPEVFRFEDYPAVETVEPGSPAESAGLRTGDVILALAERDIREREIVFASVLRPGAKLPLRLRRNGRAFDVTLLVGRRPQVFDNQCPLLDERLSVALADVPVPARVAGSTPTPYAERTPVSSRPPREPGVTVVPAPRAGSGGVLTPLAPTMTIVSATATIAGAELARMNADLREVFGVERGVLVLSVTRGTPAEDAGLRAGDVLIQADRNPVTLPSHFQRALQLSDDRSVELRVVRKKKTQTLQLSW